MVQNLKGYFMSQGSSAATATEKAYGAVWGMVQRQAAMLAYNDTFLFLGVIFVALLPLLFLLQKPKAVKPGEALMH
jgi:DHA2 family multidrug resistance protein